MQGSDHSQGRGSAVRWGEGALSLLTAPLPGRDAVVPVWTPAWLAGDAAQEGGFHQELPRPGPPTPVLPPPATSGYLSGGRHLQDAGRPGWESRAPAHRASGLASRRDTKEYSTWQWKVWRGRDRAGSQERVGWGPRRAWVWRTQGVCSQASPMGGMTVCVCYLGWGCGGECLQAEGFPAMGRGPEPDTPHPLGSVTPGQSQTEHPPHPEAGHPQERLSECPGHGTGAGWQGRGNPVPRGVQTCTCPSQGHGASQSWKHLPEPIWSPRPCSPSPAPQPCSPCPPAWISSGGMAGKAPAGRDVHRSLLSSFFFPATPPPSSSSSPPPYPPTFFPSLSFLFPSSPSLPPSLPPFLSPSSSLLGGSSVLETDRTKPFSYTPHWGSPSQTAYPSWPWGSPLPSVLAGPGPGALR